MGVGDLRELIPVLAVSERPPGRLARLERAQSHVKALEAEIATLVGGTQQLITFSGQFDQQRMAWVERVQHVADIDHGLTLLVSEAIHNFRSCLDYIIRDLSVVDSGHDRFTDHTQFPIASNKNKFPLLPRRWHDPLGGLTGDHRALVEWVQPYKRVQGYQPFRALRDLERLSNHDKHRLLQVAVMSTAAADMYIEREPRDCRIKNIHFRTFIGRPLEVGQEIMAVNLVEIGPRPHVYVKTNTAPYVGFSDGTACLDLLSDIEATVAQVVETFKGILESPDAVRTLERVLRRHRRHPAKAEMIGMLARDAEGRRLHRIWQAPKRQA